MRKKPRSDRHLQSDQRGQQRHAAAPLRVRGSEGPIREPKLVRADLHVHTLASPDCLTSPASVVRWATLRRIDVLAITDHNTIAGAQAVRQSAPFQVIVGEEISTPEGEVIGLFLREAIPPQPTPEDAIAAIRSQGGLVYIPHPCDRVRGSAIGAAALARIAPQVDIIEALNARVTWRADNEQAREMAQAGGILAAAGSDAHHGAEIGRVYVQLPPFQDAATLLESLAQATLHGRESLPLVHASSTYARVIKQVTRWRPE